MIADTNPQNKQPRTQPASDQAALIRSLLEDFKILQTQMQHLEERQSYLEYDLHNDNGNLKAENLGLRQQLDYPSDY